jgi:hypothetical protein
VSEAQSILRTRRRIRLLQLFESAERAALAPLATEKLHAFAYLADILSPVWNLVPFDQRILKTGRPPFYPDLQREIDSLVAMGLLEVSDLSYRKVPDGPMLFQARYALRFQSIHGRQIRKVLDSDCVSTTEQTYLDELARALASLRDEDIAAAAAEDATYDDPTVASGDVIDFGEAIRRVRTREATESLDLLFPDIRLTPARRLYMYAHYLGRKVHAVG